MITQAETPSDDDRLELIEMQTRRKVDDVDMSSRA